MPYTANRLRSIRRPFNGFRPVRYNNFRLVRLTDHALYGGLLTVFAPYGIIVSALYGINSFRSSAGIIAFINNRTPVYPGTWPRTPF